VQKEYDMDRYIELLKTGGTCFGSGYGRWGEIGLSAARCDVCDQPRICLWIDSSEGEYGAGHVCKHCVSVLFSQHANKHVHDLTGVYACMDVYHVRERSIYSNVSFHSDKLGWFAVRDHSFIVYVHAHYVFLEDRPEQSGVLSVINIPASEVPDGHTAHVPSNGDVLDDMGLIVVSYLRNAYDRISGRKHAQAYYVKHSQTARDGLYNANIRLDYNAEKRITAKMIVDKMR